MGPFLVFLRNSKEAGVSCLVVEFFTPEPPGKLFQSSVVVQSLSPALNFVTPWTAALQASLSFTISWSLLKLASIKSVMLCNHLILCRLLFLLSIFPSISVFSSQSAVRIGWPKYWSFSIQSFHEYSGLISFRIDWFDIGALAFSSSMNIQG